MLTPIGAFVPPPDGKHTRIDQVGKQAHVHVQIALVLSAIAELMAPGKHPPHFRADTERVRKHLKHDVSVRGAIPRAAQPREA